MERIRAFIAVELPPATREAVEDVTRRLQAGAFEGVRWVRPEGVHLTLKFLGSIGADSVPAVSKALARCAASTAPPLRALPGQRRRFPRRARPKGRLGRLGRSVGAVVRASAVAGARAGGPGVCQGEARLHSSPDPGQNQGKRAHSAKEEAGTSPRRNHH